VITNYYLNYHIIIQKIYIIKYCIRLNQTFSTLAKITLEIWNDYESKEDTLFEVFVYWLFNNHDKKEICLYIFNAKFNTCLEGGIQSDKYDFFYHVRHSIIFVPLSNHKNDKIILQIIVLLKNKIHFKWYQMSDTKYIIPFECYYFKLYKILHNHYTKNLKKHFFLEKQWKLWKR